MANRTDKSQLQDHLLCQEEYILGANKAKYYSFVEASCKKWPKNESDPDDKYELPILKYDANQDALVEQKKEH
jgi:hypothetical protein